MLLLLLPDAVVAAPVRVGVVAVEGAIGPVAEQYLRRNIQQAGTRGEQFLVVEMDSPGGLDTAMRGMVKTILASPVPVVVHVVPEGARAASAGAVIALAADIFAMAPGTNVGAAHPVAIGEKPDKVMSRKMVNDAAAYVEGIAARRGRDMQLARRMVVESLSLPAERAMEGGVADMIATDRSDLLRKLDGRAVTRGTGSIILRTADVEPVVHRMNTGERILQAISDPDVAYILMMVGLLGLFFELSTPGVILPGVVGAISLLLAFFAFQTLPVNYVGILLIFVALVLFVLEVKVVSYGMLTLGGIVVMALGSLFLFESPDPWLRVSRSLIAITVAAAAAFSVFAVSRAVRAHRHPPSTGREGLVGEPGIADTDIAAEGKVVVHGEYWNAWSEERIARGDRIVVVDLEGLRLKVKKG